MVQSIKNILKDRKNKIIILLFIGVLAIGLFLRLYHLATVPSSLFRDEVSIGYNAFSIATTFKDEHGLFLPLSFQAIGDMKLPIYIYVTIPFVKMLGLQDITPRLPAAISGILSIIVIYFLVLRLFKNQWIALLASFFLAVSPWHVFTSRIAYEPTLGLFFILLGVWLFFESTKKGYLLLLSALSLSLTFFTYHGDQLFTPLLIVGLVILGKNIWRKNKRIALFALLIIMLLGGVAAKATLLQSDVVKVSGIGFWSDKGLIYSTIDRKRNEHGSFQNSFFVKLWHSKFTAFPLTLGQNYLKAFSTQFLFEKGDQNPWQNMEEMGYFYLIDAFFIFVGLLIMVARKEPSLKYILLWLLIAPIPGSITRDAPGGSRTLTLVVPLIILIAYGVYYSLVYLHGKVGLVRIAGTSLMVLLYVISIAIFAEFYFVHFPLNRAIFYGYGYKQEALIAKASPDKRVVIKGLHEYNYPYFLYYLSYPADRFRKEVEYAPLTSDNFLPVKQFGRYSFVDSINWDSICENNGTLVFTDYNEIPIGITPDGIINYPNGKPHFAYVTTNASICNRIATKGVTFPQTK